MKNSVPIRQLFGREVRHCHLVGVGGAGMTPLALWLSGLGFSVSGGDDALSDEARVWLERGGVKITLAHELPSEVELVIFSSAIREDHAVRRAAAQRGVPQARRGEALAEALRGRKLIAVVGAHGKTTTTGMLITAFQSAGFSAGWLLGGLFRGDNLAPASVGENEWVVAEIDESDGSIDAFSPEITVATNLDWDHPDYYRQIGDLEATFAALFGRTRRAVFFNPACALSQRLARKPFGAQVFSFGFEGDFAVRILGHSDGRQLLELGERFSVRRASVRAGGDFNALNAAAALAVCTFLEANVTTQALSEYAGVRRRQEILHESPEVTVIEDYAHHPAEIAALLSGMRRLPHRRLVVAFQPHRYSRTERFKVAFAQALLGADAVFLFDVYSAGEAPLSGGTTADVYAELLNARATVAVSYLPGDSRGAITAMLSGVREGDLVLFVGAGDIDQCGREFVRRWRERTARLPLWAECFAILRERLPTTAILRREESLAGKTTLRTGGAARLYAEPANETELQIILEETNQRGLPFFILGRGSNLLVPDEGVEGVVVRLAGAAWKNFEVLADGRIAVGVGLRLKELCGLAATRGVAGFEFLEGIPGTVGGALRMNAGAMGSWMFDVVDAVRLMEFSGAVRVLERGALHASYRECREVAGAIALSAVLRPAGRAECAAIREKMDGFEVKRHESQPREPSAGCVFKNPEAMPAGKLIDELGLKGERVGDAEVSLVHGNFIVNHGNATSADVIALIRRVRARVREVRGIELEPEVLLFGREWRDFL